MSNMKVIYIAGPFRGPNAWAVEQNIRRAEALAFEVDQLGYHLQHASPPTMGCVALCPHTNTRFFNGTLDDFFWIEATKVLLEICDGVIMTPDWRKSEGARGEHNLALGKMPIVYDIPQLRAALLDTETSWPKRK